MWMPLGPTTDNEILNDTESDGYETISYTVMCDDLSEVIKGEKFPLDLKRAVQIEISQQVPDSGKINVHSEMVDILSRVTPSMMKEAQEEDIDISKLYAMSNLARNQCLDKLGKLNLDLCKGISVSLIDWYLGKECCTECMNKMGPNIINSFCQ